MPPQVRPRLHGDPGRAPVDGEPAPLGRLSTARFLKRGPAQRLAAEAQGLAALQAAGARAPALIAHRIEGKQAVLELERLELASSGDYGALARMLAAVHRSQSDRYGWPSDNYIGATPQLNGWSTDWVEFWRERRLQPQLELAARNGFDLDCHFLLQSLRTLLDHRPPASLLHGDLWNGNAGFHRGEPVLFDPAVYYGDREADLAMTELFGGFPREFYAAYEEAYPLPAGYAQRKHLYNLYHLLNHLTLFGGGYLRQVNATLGLLRGVL